MKTPTAFDFLVSDMGAYLDASAIDDAGKLLALSLLTAASAQAAPSRETETMRQARDALGDAAARFAGAALGIHVKGGEP